eukprot:Sspe_Gene.2405::Locus_796_Transcript_1_5_Confidence_0.333_Length_1727::g.2405::m.2405
MLIVALHDPPQAGVELMQLLVCAPGEELVLAVLTRVVLHAVGQRTVRIGAKHLPRFGVPLSDEAVVGSGDELVPSEVEVEVLDTPEVPVVGLDDLVVVEDVPQLALPLESSRHNHMSQRRHPADAVHPLVVPAVGVHQSLRGVAGLVVGLERAVRDDRPTLVVVEVLLVPCDFRFDCLHTPCAVPLLVLLVVHIVPLDVFIVVATALCLRASNHLPFILGDDSPVSLLEVTNREILLRLLTLLLLLRLLLLLCLLLLGQLPVLAQLLRIGFELLPLPVIKLALRHSAQFLLEGVVIHVRLVDPPLENVPLREVLGLPRVHRTDDGCVQLIRLEVCPDLSHPSGLKREGVIILNYIWCDLDESSLEGKPWWFLFTTLHRRRWLSTLFGHTQPVYDGNEVQRLL